tara:strand:+ start:2016 stop:2849 length:834 start_codon:yes stop_codon:yes gene_type:complete
MKNILVPTDFSECSRNAENLALELAKQLNAEIHFLHIFSSPVDWVKLPLAKEELYPETRLQFKQANTELNNLVKRAEKLGLKANEFIVFNEGRSAIDDHIKNHHHDFIVMGSHGAGGLKELLGSNTQKVIRYAKMPVLVVKNEVKLEQLKKLVFASSFDFNVVQPFEQIINFSSKISAEIHLLYVNSPAKFMETDEIEARMEKVLKNFENINCTKAIYNALSVERGILNYSEKIGADIITSVTHGRTGLMKMISPSITESLANHSNVPVLSIHFNTE